MNAWKAMLIIIGEHEIFKSIFCKTMRSKIVERWKFPPIIFQSHSEVVFIIFTKEVRVFCILQSRNQFRSQTAVSSDSFQTDFTKIMF